MRRKRDSNKRTRETGRANDGEKGEPRCPQCGEEISPLEALLSPVCGSCVRKNHQRAVGK